MTIRPLHCGIALAALLVAAPALDVTAPSGWSSLIAGSAEAADLSVGVFFGPLSAHGRWLTTDRYGHVWVPARVDRGWRPYTNGHWECTRRYGWVWVSDEPWGWATYHYGRWAYDEDYGWYWVPGNRWAPAWVAWHSSDDYIGWAPLPPVGSGYAFSASIGAAGIGIGAWRFVSARNFLDRDLGRHIIDVDRNDDIYRRTRAAGTVRVVNNVVVNTTINVRTVERLTKQKVEVRELRDARQQQAIKAEGKDLVAYRPQISDRKPTDRPKDAVEARRIENRTASVKADSPAQGSGRGTSAGGTPGDGARPDGRTVKGAEPAGERPAGPATDAKDGKDARSARTPDAKQSDTKQSDDGKDAPRGKDAKATPGRTGGKDSDAKQQPAASDTKAQRRERDAKAAPSAPDTRKARPGRSTKSADDDGTPARTKRQAPAPRSSKPGGPKAGGGGDDDRKTASPRRSSNDGPRVKSGGDDGPPRSRASQPSGPAGGDGPAQRAQPRSSGGDGPPRANSGRSAERAAPSGPPRAASPAPKGPQARSGGGGGGGGNDQGGGGPGSSGGKKVD